MKDETTRYFWVLLLCLIFTLGVLLLIGQARASDTNKVLKNDVPIGSILEGSPNSAWTADIDGRIYTFYASQGGSHYYLNFTHADKSSPPFQTWSNGTVADNWNAWTSITNIRACSLSNGSVVVAVKCNKPSTYNIVLFIHYYPLPLTTWVAYQAHGSATNIPYFDIASGPSDVLLISGTFGATGQSICTRLFNPATVTWAPAAGFLTNWWNGSYPCYEARVRCAPSGKWWIFWGIYYDGKLHFRDYGKTDSERTITPPSYITSGWDAIYLSSGVRCYVQPSAGSGTVKYVLLYTETGNGTNTYTTKYAWPIVSETVNPRYRWATFSHNLIGQMYIILGDGNDDKTEMVGPFGYMDPQETVQATRRDLETHGDDDHSPDCGSWHIFPKAGDVSFSLPYKGYLFTYGDHVGSTQYDHEVWYNGTNFTLPEISFPIVDQSDIDPGYTAFDYVFNLTATGGNEPYVWTMWYQGESTMYGGWLAITDEEGTLYGLCPMEEGDYLLNVTVTDGTNRHSHATFYLTVVAAPEEGGGGEEPADDWDWTPDLDYTGALWGLLAFIAVIACIYRLGMRR